MNIKQISRWLLTALFLIGSLPGQTQMDSVQTRSKWLPDHAKLQYAGGIGFLSVGAGYTTKKDKLHGDLYYGYTPESVGGVRIHALTAKATWFPLKNIERNSFQIRPLTAGVLLNYAFGKQYFAFNPDKYPYTYYDFPTSLHIGAFVGGQVNKTIRKPKGIKRIGLYYELGTFDVDMVSYAGNTKALSITDIFNLGIGVITTF